MLTVPPKKKRRRVAGTDPVQRGEKSQVLADAPRRGRPAKVRQPIPEDEVEDAQEDEEELEEEEDAAVEEAEEEEVKPTKKSRKRLQPAESDQVAVKDANAETPLYESNPISGALIPLKELNFVELTGEIGSPERANCIVERLKQVQAVDGHLRFAAAEWLIECRDREYWRMFKGVSSSGVERDYDSFYDFVGGEIGIEQRSAQSWMQLYTKYVVELGLSADSLKKVSWSSAHTLVPIVTPENASDLLEAAVGMSIRDVAVMKNAVAEGSTIKKAIDQALKRRTREPKITDESESSFDASVTRGDFKTFKVVVQADQLEIIRSAINHARQVNEDPNMTEQDAITTICATFEQETSLTDAVDDSYVLSSLNRMQTAMGSEDFHRALSEALATIYPEGESEDGDED